jgi:metal-responsive CopG/Arc/MetJ family transcriptional regulator
MRINTILSEEIIKELDAIAREEHKSRSLLLREAAEKFIEEYHRKLEEARRKKRIKQAIKTQDNLRKKSGKWNGVSEIRKWREAVK